MRVLTAYRSARVCVSAWTGGGCAVPGRAARALRPWALARARRTPHGRGRLGVCRRRRFAPLLCAARGVVAACGGDGGPGRSAARRAGARRRRRALGGARLALGAAREATALARTALAAPRAALLEIHSACGQPLSELQAATLCGRRALAWSAPVTADTLRKARAGMGMGSGAGAFLGDELAVTCRNVSISTAECDFILQHVTACYNVAGMLHIVV
ncbi:Protein of unknown function [Gryllus bimaculatus]|nr:Protein of unknown function [Gryllus bimaculatus]